EVAVAHRAFPWRGRTRRPGGREARASGRRSRHAAPGGAGQGHRHARDPEFCVGRAWRMEPGPRRVRILAPADVYQALRQPRPHRPALGAAGAERVMREEVHAGRLDGECVNAVLEAAGHRVRRRAGLPSGLTAREVEVLVRLGQGRAQPGSAAELHVSRKTVSSHLEHIYAKLGVKTRTGAALFAMRHGLTGTAGEPGT